MQGLLSQPPDNPCSFDFVSGIHRLFYEQLPACIWPRIGINRSNLWSLSRGFSRNKQWYMTNLQSADLEKTPVEPPFDLM